MTTTLNPPEPGQVGRQSSFPGARAALVLLLLINLFNYIDRQVLAVVVDFIQNSFFHNGNAGTASRDLQRLLTWCQAHLGFKPELALLGVLGTAFMVVYTIGAPVFGRLAERYSRWALVGVGVILWSLASGASGLAGGFVALLLTRCCVGVGEAAYGPVAPALISDFYPVKMRGQVLAYFYLAIPVGTALGFVIGDAVARSGIGPWGGRALGIHAESWRWAFYVVVVPGILLGLWSLFMKDPPRGQADLQHGVGARKVAWRDYGVLLRTPSLRPVHPGHDGHDVRHGRHCILDAVLPGAQSRQARCGEDHFRRGHRGCGSMRDAARRRGRRQAPVRASPVRISWCPVWRCWSASPSCC